jgi:hypothetical protein
MIDWQIAQFSPHAPGFWLLLSLLTTAALSVPLNRRRRPWVQWLWLGHWLLIPYFGLLFGGLSPRLMGLAYFDWSVSLSLGIGLIFAVLALLVIVRMTVDLPSPHQSRTEESAPIKSSGAEHPLDAHRPAWQAVLMLIAAGGVEQFHWTFLRGSLWEILLALPEPPELPAYWAVWIAALIVILTAALRRPTVLQWLLLLATLVTTSILFFYTHNFWLCWILHSATDLILASYSQARPLSSGSASSFPR